MAAFGQRLPAKLSNGEYPAFTSVGSYTLIYLTRNGDVFCATCASQDGVELAIENHDVFYEGHTHYCNGCGEPIFPAYPTKQQEKEMNSRGKG